MNEKRKMRQYEIDRERRAARRRAPRTVKHAYHLQGSDGEVVEVRRESETTPEQTEARQIAAQAARGFIETVEFYKSEMYGSLPHDEAVKKTLALNEWRRNYVQGLQPEKVEWGHIAAVAEVDTQDALKLWGRVREAADDELESGRRGAAVTGERVEPYAYAQFLAIRDSFADQWQPQGGIESAMIDMLAVAFSLQMYWSTIAHQRALHEHDEQRKDLNRYETKGWKSPYQCEADAIDQAHRLADGYNRQFLRVLRQLRDLRRYAPVVIQNNGGQVNVAGQQVNVNKS
ncbi:MAG: hypothetical protein LC742_00055 [Acidobacteria bacterium]|nr:hypothetical protein [Acidobacteriota bacterium]